MLSDMASFFDLVFIMMLSSALAAQNFVSVSVCPRDQYTWDLESNKKKCQGDTPDYLCAAIENQLGKYGEICTKFGLTPANKCAVLNEQTKNLDSVDCKADSGCPTDPYIPSVLWKYQICYKDFYGTTTSPAPITTPNITSTTASSGSGGSGSGAGVAVAVILIILIIFVVVMVVFYVRNLFGFRDKVQQLYTDLRKYFQHGDEYSADADNCEAPNPQEPHNPQEPLLKKDVKHVKENETNSEKVTNTSNTGGTKEEGQKEKPVNAKPEKTIAKKEKVTNASNTGGTKEEGHIDINDEPPEKKIEKLEELLKYLVHILKQELGVSDLKEKVVIHSKSINEHFSEPLIKDLQSLKDINDYSQLDTSLVLTLLRNFCEGIKPPSRGWDYEPPDDETQVGADIERIRSMWNKYCDNDFVFKHLDDVYNRIKLKYGTIAVQGDDGIMKSSSKDEESTETIHGNDGVSKSPSKDGENTEGSELMKEKINSIKLNPDCTVEKGIVITENITTAVRLLKTRNVVILKGVIGCGKTHALKAIQNHFQGTGWETEWVESENLLGEISAKRPTILLCDNLFGQFGSCVFSQTDVEKTGKTLGAIEGAGGNIKVVIGIHTHVYDEVNKSLKLNFIKKNITVDMDKLSEAETLLIFKKQLTKGHCEMDPNCWFRSVGFQSVLDKLSKNQGHIGGPFLSLMYCNQHELFSEEAFSVNPVRTLVQHIEKMKHDSTITYDCLVYLMCVQQHNIEEEPEKWVGYISVDITKHHLMQLSKTSGLLRVENKIATLAHELLTTVLFKCAAVKIEIFLPVLQLCKIDVFLQLLRPTDSTHSDLYFEYIFNDFGNFSKDVGKMCAYRLAKEYENHEITHPLMTVEIVNNKYLEYLKREPKLLPFIRGVM